MNYKKELKKMGWSEEEAIKRINSLNETETITKEELKNADTECVLSFFQNTDKNAEDIQ